MASSVIETRDQVVAEQDDELFPGHFSYEDLNQYFYWSGINSIIFKKCITCATVQGQEKK